MVGVRRGLAVCLVGLVVLLAVLDVGPAAGAVGLGCAVVLAVAAGRRATADGVALLGPADLVTLTRHILQGSGGVGTNDRAKVHLPFSVRGPEEGPGHLDQRCLIARL